MSGPMQADRLELVRDGYGHGMSGVQEELLAHADHWEAAYRERTAEWKQALGDRDEANALAKRYRKRCPVLASDVETAGLTRDHLTRWLTSIGWSPTDETSTRFALVDAQHASTLTMWRPVPRTGNGVGVPDTNASADIADAVRTMAYHLGLDRWDVFDEMAAMPEPVAPEAKWGPPKTIDQLLESKIPREREVGQVLAESRVHGHRGGLPFMGGVELIVPIRAPGELTARVRVEPVAK